MAGAEGTAQASPPVPRRRRARCAGHPSDPSEGTCSGCGLFLCQPCLDEREGRCVRCGSSQHPIPWEDPQRGKVRGFFATLSALSRPKTFFKDAPWTGGLKRPLGFAMLCGIVGAIGKGISLLLVALLLRSDGLARLIQSTYAPLAKGNRAFQRSLELMPAQLDQVAEAVARSAFSGLLVSPLEAVFAIFVLAALTHPVARWLGGRGSFEGTFRVLAYASGAQVVKLVPVLGLPLAVLAGLLLTVVGMRRAHGLTGGKSLIAALWWVPPAIVLLGLFAFWALAVMIKVVLGG